MNYAEVLKDPRWQKARLKSMERAGWMCERCLASEKTLHVHHKQYIKGRSPWEYSNDELLVLCDACHQAEHRELDLLRQSLSRMWITPADCRGLIDGYCLPPPSHTDDLSAIEYQQLVGAIARRMDGLPVERLRAALEFVDLLWIDEVMKS